MYFPRPKIAYIDGLPGSHKTTLIECWERNSSYEVMAITEPVDLWLNHFPSSLLQEKNAFGQLMISSCKELHMRKIIEEKFSAEFATKPDIILIERNMYSSSRIFSKLFEEENSEQKVEHLEKMFELWSQHFLHRYHIDLMKPDLIVYLKVPPRICQQYIHHRNRDREGRDWTLEKLAKLDELHDAWHLLEYPPLKPKYLLRLSGDPALFSTDQGLIRSIEKGLYEECPLF